MKPIYRLAVALALPLSAAAAQESPTLAPGSRVRVINTDRRVVGTLESVDSATITVRRQNGQVVTLPRVPRTRLDVSAGPGMCSPGHRGTCVVAGFLGGAILGLGVGAIVVSGCQDELCGLYYFLTVPAGAVVGTLVGAVVGGEHWKRTEIPVRLTLAPAGPGGVGRWDGARVGVQLTF